MVTNKGRGAAHKSPKNRCWAWGSVIDLDTLLSLFTVYCPTCGRDSRKGRARKGR